MIGLAAVSLLASCAKEEATGTDPYATNFVYLKAPLASTYRATFSTAGNWKNKPEEVTAFTQIRCTKPAPKDIKVSVEIDESMVEAYNAANGTDYKFLNGIELVKTDFVINKGEYISADTLKTALTNYDEFIEGGTAKYIVPIRMTKTSAGTLSESNFFYVFYDAAMLFGETIGSYTGTILDRSDWTVYVNGVDKTSTLTDGSKYTDVYNLFGDNVISIDLGQVYDNIVNIGVDHYGSSYGCNEFKFEISTDDVEYRDLGTYNGYGLGSAVLDIFDPQEGRYIKITGISPISTYYGWDIGEVNVAVAE